jgi:hypothetical protein
MTSRTILINIFGLTTTSKVNWSEAIGYWKSFMRPGTQSSTDWGYMTRYYEWYNVKSKTDHRAAGGKSSLIKDKPQRQILVHIPDVDKMNWDRAFKGWEFDMPQSKAARYPDHEWYELGTESCLEGTCQCCGQQLPEKEPEKEPEIDLEVRDKVVKHIRETVISNHERAMSLVESMGNAANTDELLRLKRDLLVTLLSNLPLNGKDCYYCELTNVMCHMCGYGKAHGICVIYNHKRGQNGSPNNDFCKIIRAIKTARSTMELYYNGKEGVR